MDELQSRYEAVCSRIQQACLKSNRSSSQIRLIAASKTRTAEEVAALHEKGVVWFGENYCQELEQKAASLENTSIKWAFIGSIQSNKIKKIVRWADEIQSVASRRHVELISRSAAHQNKNDFPIYIVVNFGGEATKSGCGPDEVLDLACYAQEFGNLRVEGVMCLPPKIWMNDKTLLYFKYAQLRLLADRVGNKKLSLGMSADLEDAIEHGTQNVRVGTGLFGPRSLKSN